MQPNFAILINTTDSFDDCWIPFFILFKKYWHNYEGKLYLNTEIKQFSYLDLNIISIQNNINNPKKSITWSDCLLRALDAVDYEIILYMQEDYFIKDHVKNDLVEKYVKLISDNSEIDCIHLTDQGVLNDIKCEFYEGLYNVIPNQRYLVSCQAALWRKKSLKSILRNYENAWQFEEFGSKRASKMGLNILGVDKNWIRLNEFEIIPYLFTGIIQGRWYEPVVELFKQNNILIDYSKRGFVKDSLQYSFVKRLYNKLIRFRVVYKNWIEK